MNKLGPLFLVAIICISGLSACNRGTIDKPLKKALQRNNSAEGFLSLNAADPGAEANIRSAIVFGKYTIVEFTSPGCGACQMMKPYLEQIHDRRKDIVVRSFDVNRKGSDGIDWQSPLARQYNLHRLPAFKIFNDKGVIISEDSDASEQVRRVIQDYVINAHKVE